MSKFKIFFTALLLSASAYADDDNLTVNEVVTAVEQVYGGVTALKADFVQVTKSAALGDEQKQRGQMTMMRPRMMRWEFTGPDNKLFVTDGSTMWIYSPSDNQVIVYKDYSISSDGVGSLLSDLDRLSEIFDTELLKEQEDAKSITLKLVPKNETMSFKELRITLTKKKYLIEKVLITDQYGNTTDLAFSQQKIDPKVDTSEFSFQIPEGVELISPEGF